MAHLIKKPIAVVRAVTLVAYWKILGYQDSVVDNVRGVRILVQVYQDNERNYGVFWLQAYDAQNSLCLHVNPSPTTQDDQFLLGFRSLPGACSRITTAYIAARGNHDEKLVAIETTLLDVGLLDLAFR
jgi:hypothetical protein